MTADAQLHQRLTQLLRARSVEHGDFLLASGRRSRFYIDARKTTMCAEGLAVIGALGVARLAARGWRPDAVGGMTLGADPVAYAVALTSRTQGAASPMDAFTVRKQAKDHGTGRRIEGCFAPGARVVVVEDVVTTGHSALDAISAVRDEGGQVLGVLAVVDREEGGRAAIEGAGYGLETLVTAGDLGLA